MIDVLRIAHLRIAPQEGNLEVGNCEGNQFYTLDRASQYYMTGPPPIYNLFHNCTKPDPVNAKCQQQCK